MWNGKKKALTFSFDDGVTQDIRTVEILNKYGLKATFNLNSGLFGGPGNEWSDNEKVVIRKPIKAEDAKALYDGHEVAVHTLHHPNLTKLEKDEIVKEVEEDRQYLSELVGYEVIGMAYPCGGVNNDDRVAQIIKENTGVRYARTITSTHSFELQDNLLRFNPTVYVRETDKMFELAEAFLALETDKPQLLYIWGHSYEFDGIRVTFEKLERLCKMLSGKADIFYGTNKEVLL